MEGLAVFLIVFTLLIVIVFSLNIRGKIMGHNKFNIGDHVKVIDKDDYEYNDEKFEITKIYSKRNDVLYA